MFLGIPELSKFLGRLKVAKLDDFADRCNYFYTVIILIFFSLLIGTKQHFGEPIRCLIDQQYSSSWVGYVHDYCFITERYSLHSAENDIFSRYDNTDSEKENYYQWVPYLLAAQALAFYFPHFLWRSFQKMSSLDLETAVEEATKIHSLFGEERKNAIADLVKYIEQFLNYSIPGNSCSLNCAGRFGSFSSVLYVLSKLFNIANVTAQIYVINTFVGNGDFLWGIELANHLLEGRDWTHTGHFPRVVFCNYDRIELGNVQHKTVQCALPINILNEKVFVLLSIWLMFVLVITLINAVTTALILFIPYLREREGAFYLERSLDFDDSAENGDQGNCYGKKFGKMDSHSAVCDGTQKAMGENSNDDFLHAKLREELQRMARFNGNVDVQRDRMQRSAGGQSVKDDVAGAKISEYECRELLHEFFSYALRTDGVQLLRFVRTHAGAMVVHDLAIALWKNFMKKKAACHRQCSYDLQRCYSGSDNRKWEDALVNNPKGVEASPLLKISGDYADVADLRAHYAPPACSPDFGNAKTVSNDSVCDSGFVRDDTFDASETSAGRNGPANVAKKEGAMDLKPMGPNNTQC